MIAVAKSLPRHSMSNDDGKSPRVLNTLLEKIDVATGASCTVEESRRFLLSTGSVTRTACADAGPTAQDVECVRQATFKHRLETGADRATAGDLMPTLERLGYV